MKPMIGSEIICEVCQLIDHRDLARVWVDAAVTRLRLRRFDLIHMDV
jgi:hypothetical protein